MFTNTNEPERIEKVKATDSNGQVTEMLPLQANQFSLSNLQTSVYILNVIIDNPSSNSLNAYETILVILAPDQQPIQKTEITKIINKIKVSVRVDFDKDPKPRPKPSPCYFDPSLEECKPNDGRCPPGFGFNDDDQCIPHGKCPNDYGRLDDDETGKCYKKDDIKKCSDGSTIHKDEKCPSESDLRPHLKFGELAKIRINNLTMRSHHESQNFIGNVWLLPVRNHDYRIFRRISFTRMGSYCNFRLNVIRNGISERNQIPLTMIGNNSLPTSSNYPASIENGQTLSDVLPLCYIGDLFQAAVGFADLPKGTHNRILFLFSFEGSELVYIIVSSLRNGIRQDDIPFLSLLFNTEYEIQVVCYCTDYKDADGKRFKLVANSWDEILFSKL